MSKQVINLNYPADLINIGATANDRNGDPLRTAFTKINDAVDRIDSNFSELYNASTLVVSNNSPDTPITGSLWYDTVSGRMYVYYDSNWIDTNPSDVFTLPSQSGNVGKFLTTNGSTTSWATVSSSTNQLVSGDKTVSLATTGILTLPSSSYLESTDTNLKVGAQGTVTIRSDAASNLTTKSWIFGTDGALDTPTNLKIAKLGDYSPSLGTMLIQNTNESIHILAPGDNSHVLVGWSSTNGLKTATVGFNADSDGLEGVKISAGNFASTVHGWVFGTDGSFTIPNNGAGIRWNNPDEPPMPIGGWLANSTIAFDKDLGIVLSNSVGGIGGYSWILGKDGKLKLPATGNISNTAGLAIGTIHSFSADYMGATGPNTASEVYLPDNANSQEIQTGWIITFTDASTATVTAVTRVPTVHVHVEWVGSKTFSYPVTVQSADYTPADPTVLELSPDGTTTWTFGADGTLTLPASGTISGLAAASITSSTAASIGYIGMPQNSKAVNYELVIGDMGKHIFVTATSTVTVPAYTSIDFPVGTTIAIVAGTGATATIEITTDTMYLAGAGTTGARTLAPYGMATLVKVAQSTWFISGVGLT